MKWMFVFMVLIGDYLIVKKNRIGFMIWMIVDGYFSLSNFFDMNYAEGSIFGLYVVMGMYGLFAWKTVE